MVDEKKNEIITCLLNCCVAYYRSSCECLDHIYDPAFNLALDLIGVPPENTSSYPRLHEYLQENDGYYPDGVFCRDFCYEIFFSYCEQNRTINDFIKTMKGGAPCPIK